MNYGIINENNEWKENGILKFYLKGKQFFLPTLDAKELGSLKDILKTFSSTG